LTPKNEVAPSVGAYIGALSLGVPGAFADDSAVSFSGTGRVEVGDQLDFDGDVAMSLEVWMKADGGGLLVGKTADSADRTGWQFYIAISPDIAAFVFERGANADAVSTCTVYFKDLPGPAPVNDDRYHLATATYDTVTTRIYLDGKEMKAPCEKVGGASKPFLIPKTGLPLTFGRKFKGILDEVAIYDKALPPPRVEAHFKARSDTP
jgi:hypothetical protein